MCCMRECLGAQPKEKEGAPGISVCLCDRKRIRIGERGHSGKQCTKVEIVYHISGDKEDVDKRIHTKSAAIIKEARDG